MKTFTVFKPFIVFGVFTSSVFAGTPPSDPSVNNEITSQWKGGKVTVRDKDKNIIDVYPGYLDIANGKNCLLSDNSAVRRPVLDECSPPGFTNTDPNKEVYLTVEVVPGNPGLCLAVDQRGHVDSVILEKCDHNNKDQTWLYRYSEVRLGNGINSCLTANGLGKEVALTECKGFAQQSWKLP